MWFLLLASALAGTIQDAIITRQNGNLAGATALLEAYAPFPEEQAWYLYQRGICAELGNRPAQAEAWYRQAIAAGAVDDARFRLALVLEDQGRDQEALTEVITLARQKGFDERDQATLDLQLGISEVNTGKKRKGLRRIQATLDGLEAGASHTWMRAKGRYTLARLLLEEADSLDLRLPERRQVRRLTRRAESLQAAEQQVAAIARLNEPEWVLAGLIALGDSHARLAREIATAPPPRRLTPSEDGIYREMIIDKAAVIDAKARHIWQSGVDLAARIQWESPRVAALKLRLAP